MATAGTLLGFSESEFSVLMLGCGIVGVVLLKLALIRYLVRNQKVGVTGSYVLYGVLALSVLSILVIVFMLYFWKV